MSTHTQFRKWLAGLAILLVLVLSWSLLQRHRNSSAKIQQARAADSPLKVRDVLSGQRSLEPNRWRELVGSEDESLRLGAAKLEWSVASLRSGYLYFHDPDTMPRRMIWELASCDRKDLKDLRPEDLRCRFYAADDPGAPQAFAAKWRNNAIIVNQGEIVLARLVRDTNTIYAVHFVEQKGDLGQQVRVKFRTIDAKRGL